VIWTLILAIPVLYVAEVLLTGSLTDMGVEDVLFLIPGLAIPALFSVGHFVCSLRLGKDPMAARGLLTFFGLTGLLRLPFGTVASILTFVALWREGHPAREGERPRQPLGRLIGVFGGLWYLEILVVIAATFAINIGSATSSSHVKRSMSDMRSVATAVESYAIDYDSYPPAKSMEELSPTISPLYIKVVPLKDGWGRDFRYQTSPDAKSYVIVSAGKDGTFERPDPFSYTENPNSDYNADIVFRDGQFIQYFGHVHSPNE
jgi:hypothetical protein